MVDRGGDVEKRPGPATSLLPDPPVLDVPGGRSRRREGGGESGHQRPVPTVAPEAAVDQDDRGERSLPGRQVEVRDLVRV